MSKMGKPVYFGASWSHAPRLILLNFALRGGGRKPAGRGGNEDFIVKCGELRRFI